MFLHKSDLGSPRIKTSLVAAADTLTAIERLARLFAFSACVTEKEWLISIFFWYRHLAFVDTEFQTFATTKRGIRWE